MEKELEKNEKKKRRPRGNKIHWNGRNQNGNGMKKFRLRMTLCNRMNMEQRWNRNRMEKTINQVEAKLDEMEWNGKGYGIEK